VWQMMSSQDVTSGPQTVTSWATASRITSAPDRYPDLAHPQVSAGQPSTSRKETSCTHAMAQVENETSTEPDRR
jgi:hypothetical protein